MDCLVWQYSCVMYWHDFWVRVSNDLSYTWPWPHAEVMSRCKLRTYLDISDRPQATPYDIIMAFLSLVISEKSHCWTVPMSSERILEGRITCGPCLDFQPKSLLADLFQKVRTAKKHMECDFCKSDPRHIRGWSEMWFQLDFYRCMSQSGRSGCSNRIYKCLFSQPNHA